MAARAGMTNLITETRRLASAGTADHTVAGETFWTDDQIQAQLDETRTVYKYQPLALQQEYTDGTSYYYDYFFPEYITRVEEGGTTNTGFKITTSTGSTAPSYTVNYQAGQVRFAADTGGTAYYMDCRAYNVNRAVADIWAMKAGFVATNVDWSSDNHRFAASQEAEAYRKQAAKFRSLAGVSVGIFQRTDEI